ncbi:MAG: hypothetical protein AAB288_06440, partial [Acidobacteriota bacterium]
MRFFSHGSWWKVLTIFFLAFIADIHAQAAPLVEKKVTVSVKGAALGDVFRTLIVDYDVPIGFEESELDGKHHDFDFDTNIPFTRTTEHGSPANPVTVSVTMQDVFEPKSVMFSLDMKNEKLPKVLDEITKQMRNYAWSINDGVVNIYPIRGRREVFRRLLDVKISKFQTKQRRIDILKAYIVALPELKAFADQKSLVLTRRRTYYSPNGDRNLPTQELNFTDLTLRSLLNKITLIKRGG